MNKVAALYIDPRGPYPGMRGVDCWDATRDARLYHGPHPVVAHPPCGPWSRLRHLYQGSEHDCAVRAVAQVQAHGGVLEHPAHSRLWAACGLPLPGDPSDGHGITIQVDQVRWGHVARKRTWLYLVGVRARVRLPPPREPTHWIGSYRKHNAFNAKRRGAPAPDHIKICSAQQARRTPPAFAKWLVSLARSV